jgi:miniconductance mechanosensitive channel
MKRLQRLLYDYLLEFGINETAVKYITMLLLLVLATVVVLGIDYLFRKILIAVFNRFAAKSKTNFDDLLVQNKAPRNIAHIVPLFLFYTLIPVIFVDFNDAQLLLIKAVEVFGIVLTLWIVRSLLSTLKDFFKTLANFKDKPIDSYIQVFMIFAWITGFLFSFAILTDTSVWKFLTALGAASAVIILVFKDTIMGFVASIQVSINDMVRIGDWITFDQYGADGDVTEINLATVKVQNFDKTITTIPTYALISESFKNWRGMVSSEGRRIKRALIIKQESIKYLDEEAISRLKKVDLLSAYIVNRSQEILAYNSKHQIDKSLLLNGRNLTNIGVFRKYVETYLEQHAAINKDMMIMARQLAPTSQGIPIEIYAFSKDKRWQNYEYIMADIFDHLLASLAYFDLQLFELPSNTSFS